MSGETAIFSIHDKKDYEIHEIVQQVYDALKEKGYNPVNQLVGYILSEDPTYITTYKNARSMIRKVDRDDLLQAMLRSELQAHPRLALLGDFNITADDRDSYDPEGLRETIHHTSEERAHFQALLALGLSDAFRMFEQPEKSYSWWDYRDFGFRRNRGLRIDHILVSEALKPLVTACTIDKLPRKNERPSDHAPVVVDLSLAG